MKHLIKISAFAFMMGLFFMSSNVFGQNNVKTTEVKSVSTTNQSITGKNATEADPTLRDNSSEMKSGSSCTGKNTSKSCCSHGQQQPSCHSKKGSSNSSCTGKKED